MPRPFTPAQIANLHGQTSRRLSSDRFLGAWLDDRKVVVRRTGRRIHILYVRDPGGEAFYQLGAATTTSPAKAATIANGFLGIHTGAGA